MKVDIVCSSRELFGADRCALRLGKVFAGLGHDVTLVLPASRPERGLGVAAENAGIAIVEERVAIASSSGIELVAAGLPRRLATSCDLTILNSSAVLGSGRRGRARITVVREWLDPGDPRHRALAVWHRLSSKAVVAVSTGVLDQWRRCVRGPRSEYVVPDWLDAAALEGALDDPGRERARRILCIGRFNGWKGQELLARAFVRAFPTGPRPALTFVGAQPGTEFEQRAAALSAWGEREGWNVERFVEDPTPYFDSASLLVVPSLHPEPFGLVLLEGLARGCRVISFPGGGPDDLAAIFDPVLELVGRGEHALADAIARWWSDGGRPQTRPEIDQTRDNLRRGWSPAAARRRWTRILGELGVD